MIYWPTLLKRLNRNGNIDVNAVEDVIAGAANQSGEDNRNVARMAALLAGFRLQWRKHRKPFMRQRPSGLLWMLPVPL